MKLRNFSETPLALLPDDIWRLIFCGLQVREFAKLTCCCKSLREKILSLENTQVIARYRILCEGVAKIDFGTISSKLSSKYFRFLSLIAKRAYLSTQIGETWR